MLFHILLILSLINKYSSQCISQSIYPTCQFCDPLYYDSTFLNTFLLHSSALQTASCLPRASTPHYIKKILITNQPDCSSENLTGFDECYPKLLAAIQTENVASYTYINCELSFWFKSGEHQLEAQDLQVSTPNFFRQSNCSISFQPQISGSLATLSIQSNGFFLFVAQSMILDSINLIWTGGNSSIPSLSYIQNNDQEFAFINVEAMFGSGINAVLEVRNCQFQDFFVTDLQNAWGRLFLVGKNATINISNCVFENSLLPLGVVVSLQILYPGFLKTYPETNYIVFNNSTLNGISAIMGLIRISNTWAITDLEINQSSFSQISGNNGILICTICQTITISDSSFKIINETTILSANGGNSLTINNTILSNISMNVSIPFVLQSILHEIAIISLNVSQIQADTFFQISSCTINFQNTSISEIVVASSIFSFVSTTFNLSNSSFWLISGSKTISAFLSIEKSTNIFISLCSFFNITNIYTLFAVTNCNLLLLSDVIIYSSQIFNIFLMSIVDRNTNTRLQVFNNTLNYVFSNDHTCVNTELLSSSIQNNAIINKLLCINTLSTVVFTANDTTVTDNNMIKDLSLIVMLVGTTHINNCVFMRIYFLNSIAYQMAFDFETTDIFFMQDCYLEDIGVIQEKTYYLTKDNNVVISFWSMSYSSLKNSVFVVTHMIDMVTGFIEGMPHGGYFESIDNTFIILDTNPNFRYKGILLDHFVSALFSGNRFYNLRCNNQDFYHNNGGVVLGANTNIYYSKNSYTLIMTNNSFFNCQCENVGALAIVSICNVTMNNNTFINSTSNNYAGHLMISGGENLIITNVTLLNSSSGNGGAIYIRGFISVIITQMNLTLSKATGNGGFYLNNVIYCEITNSFVLNSTTLTYGGFLYVFQTSLLISNCQIDLVMSELDGGAIYLDGASNLTMDNSTITKSSSTQGSGGAIFCSNTVAVSLTNNLFYKSSANLQGGALFFDVIASLSAVNISIYDSQASGNGQIFIKTETDTTTFYFSGLICNRTIAIKGGCIYYLSASTLEIDGIFVINSFQLPLYIYWSFEIDVLIMLCLLLI